MNIVGKKILILGANPETASLVCKANELGLITYVTDFNPIAYSKKYATIPCDIDAVNVEELEKLIKEQKIDGVLCGVAESLMLTYERICSDMGFPCFGNKNLFELLINKASFKEKCRQFDVPVVDEYHLNDYSDQSLKSISFPAVVKPVDSCSSKGISICNNVSELKKGIKKALASSKNKKIIIEKYMTGDEVVIYYAFQNGEPSLVAMCDRYTNKEQKGVAQLPTSYIFPSIYLHKYIKTVDKKVKEMFKGLGIKNGFMFIQSFIDENGGVRFYEPGYRLNGAQEHFIVNKTTNIDAKECLIRFALTGIEADYRLAERADPFLNNQFGCKLSPLVKEGKIKQIIGLDEISKNKDVISINPSYSNGDEVTGYGTLKQISCRFFVVADSIEKLKNDIDFINENFDVIDENDNSMLLKGFNTDFLRERYE